MQNSGFGNAIDPLTSLCAKQVYSIPLLILIGWRGAPNIKDAPQHTMVGETILRQLKLFKIKNVTLKTDKDLKKISKLINFAKKNKTPVACLIEPKTFTKVKNSRKIIEDKNSISRPEAIAAILENIKRKLKLFRLLAILLGNYIRLIKKQKKPCQRIFNGRWYGTYCYNFPWFINTK